MACISYIDLRTKVCLSVSPRAGVHSVAKLFGACVGRNIENNEDIDNLRKDFGATVYSKEDIIKNTTRLKFVRNPFYRAVSSYRWFNLHSDVNNRQHMTFENFVEYLELVDIVNCNFHWAQQWEEHDNIYEIIKENEYDKAIRLLGNIHYKFSIINKSERCSHTGYVGNLTYTSILEIFGGQPDYNYFYNETTRKKISCIYNNDIIHYGYK